jgi:hypothetical protein
MVLQFFKSRPRLLSISAVRADHAIDSIVVAGRWSPIRIVFSNTSDIASCFGLSFCKSCCLTRRRLDRTAIDENGTSGTPLGGEPRTWEDVAVCVTDNRLGRMLGIGSRLPSVVTNLACPLAAIWMAGWHARLTGIVTMAMRADAVVWRLVERYATKKFINGKSIDVLLETVRS